MSTPVAARILATVALVTGVLGGCGSGGASRATTGCGPVRTEALDRRSLVHVLPGAPTTTYLTDPPTSGPHQPSPPATGVVDHPIDRPVQVGILESGKVLLQHRGLTPAARTAVEALAGPTVVVAPSVDLPTDDQVVATAWLTKQECRTADPAALRAFVAAHQGQGPGRP